MIKGVLPPLVTPMSFLISILLGNDISFSDAVEFLVLIGEFKHFLGELVDMQKIYVDKSLQLMKVNVFLN